MDQVKVSISSSERKELRHVVDCLRRQKWRAAYQAVDALRYVRALEVEGDQAQYSTLPATVTNMRTWRALRALEKVIQHAKEIS